MLNNTTHPGGEFSKPEDWKPKEKKMSQEERSYVDSTGQARVINNVMRHAYRQLSEEEKAQMQTIKDMGLEFYNYLDNIASSRELSLAKTKVEEAVMWAVKHVTR